ncbi:uncharacterized protein K02A2.6-like [Anneissia japonica]|uniref:uncharacterized protein K02A2.6-like n=1 Tax=Anneissia japonica TaxID=1529436 RepID=UPI0014259F95|nr:uncharacterized protein K02A2.6-like [Anneissia japonica]
MPTAKVDYIDEASLIYTSQIERLPISSTQIRKETQRDPVLSHVLDNVLKGTNKLPNDEIFKPFHSRLTELTCHQVCIMWGNRVLIPEKLRTAILDELHNGHIGIVKMKSLARSYVWWPNVDSENEHGCKACISCQQTSKMPKAAPVHPWEWTSTPWDRLHVDFVGPFMNCMFLIVVDAHSKWPEVFPMKSTTALRTIEKLRILFSQCGIPRQLVTDNESTTPHTLTKETPAKLLYGRNLRTRLDILKPDLTAKVLEGQDRMKFSKHCGANVREFEPGQQVMVRDYRSTNTKWIPAQIQEKTGPLSYTVNPGMGTLWRRHTDQLHPTAVKVTPTVTLSPDNTQSLTDASKPESLISTDIKETYMPTTITPTTESPSTLKAEHVRRYSRRENVRPPDRLNL